MAGALTAAIAAIFSGSAVTADPYYEYTTLLLPGNGTNGAQNNTFLDGSTNNFTITRNGNTTQGTFSPFSQTGWGNYFNGSSCISTADSADFTFGTGNFTVQCWLYSTLTGTLQWVAGQSASNAANSTISFSIQKTSGNKIDCSVFSGGTQYQIVSTGNLPENQWVHVAFVRDGNTCRLYIGGIQDGTVSVTGVTVNDSVYQVSIGQLGEYTTNRYTGYVSNFSIIKGTCSYPNGTTFTVPTTPLSASATNQSLLTCTANRFIDTNTATTAKTITVTGSPTVVAFSPFNPTASWSAATYGGSGYFDGSGDYLSIADNDAFALGSNDWTIECWVYVSSLSAQGFIAQVASNGADASIGFVLGINGSGYPYVASYINGAYTAATASTAIVTNQWNHIAGSRASGTMGVFLNGSRLTSTAVSGSSVNSTATVTVGASNSGSSALTTGYISNARIVNGTAVYSGSTYTVPTAPLTAITNTSLLLNFTNAGIYDATSKNDLETVGTSQISTAQYKFPPSSIYFPGSNAACISEPSSTNYGYGTGDFTIEFWIRFGSTGSQTIVSNLTTTASVAPHIYISAGTIKYYTASADRITSSSVTTGVWYHFALCRSGSSTKMFLDGTQTGSTYTDTNNYGTTNPLGVGDYGYPPSGGNRFGDGYIQDLRITKYARYTANFTPPTAAFPTL